MQANQPAVTSAEDTVPREAVRQAVDAAIDRYIAARRARVDAFARRTFGWRGALSLHRKSLGWDLLRMPANAALAAPNLARYAAAQGARAAGFRKAADRLGAAPPLSVTTDVAREVEWLLLTDLLELPFVQVEAGRPVRRSDRDALAEEILNDPAVAPVLLAVLREIGARSDDAGYRRWLTETMEAYASTRVAAAEMASTLMHAGVGALAFRQWTPGALTLGPLLAKTVARKAAMLALPLGSGLGAIGFGAAPVAAAPLLTAGITAGIAGGLLLLPALAASFAGVVLDPVQVHLRLHQRRLHRLIDSLERELKGSGDSRFVIRDHYVARVLDLIELARTAIPRR